MICRWKPQGEVIGGFHESFEANNPHGVGANYPMSSRIAWFVVAATILVVSFLLGLRVVPMYAAVLGGFGPKLASLTQLTFLLGPGALVSTGAITAMTIVISEFAPTLRAMRVPLILLVVTLLGITIVSLLLPIHSLSCCPENPE